MTLLARLEQAIKDTTSTLYQGHVTCSVDPTFVAGLSATANALAFMHSPDANVQRVLEKYSRMEVPEGPVDVSCFAIKLKWNSIEQDLWVLNPRLFDKKACKVWPHDIIRALGLQGTVSEMWLTPKKLVAVGLQNTLASAIEFEPSVRSDDLPTIDATLLKAGLTYKVVMDDKRAQAVQRLTPEEKQSIFETFKQFDQNGDNTISREEAMMFAEARTDRNKAAIEAQYQAFVAEHPGEIDKAEETRDQHLQNLKEAEHALINMFENADTDGDGELSMNEFALAEAWWMKSTMNPEKLALF